MSQRKKPRPVMLKSVTVVQPSAHGKLYVTITYKIRSKPFEVFCQVGKAGSCERAYLEAITRAISTGLRYGVPAYEYVDQLTGILCDVVSDGEMLVKSPADGVAKVIKGFVERKYV